MSVRRCASPVSFETLVAYWAGDLDAAQTDELDAHLFGCATCSAASARIASVTEHLRSLEPPIISAGRLAELRALGRRIDDSFVAPGSRNKVVFDKQELLIHHLGGLDLRDTEHVTVSVRNDDTGELLLEIPHAPFDAENGEILVACQRHFAAFPPNILLVVTALDRTKEETTVKYVVLHEWAR